jgi:hypothetical protein
MLPARIISIATCIVVHQFNLPAYKTYKDLMFQIRLRMGIAVIQSADSSPGFLGDGFRELLEGYLTVTLAITVGAVHRSDYPVDVLIGDTVRENRSEVFLSA